MRFFEGAKHDADVRYDAVTTDAAATQPHPLDPLTMDEVRAANAIWRADERIPDQVVVHVGASTSPEGRARRARPRLAGRPARAVPAAVPEVRHRVQRRRLRHARRDRCAGASGGLAPAVRRDGALRRRRGGAQRPALHRRLQRARRRRHERRCRSTRGRLAGSTSRGRRCRTGDPAGRAGRRLLASRPDRQRIRPSARRAGRDRSTSTPPRCSTSSTSRRVRCRARSTGTTASTRGSPRGTAKPIEITQPHGTSFTVTGNHVSWEGWSFRFTMHPVTGLVIHNVTYRGRSIAHRLSVSEMVVPYARAAARAPDGRTPSTPASCRWASS